MGKKALLISLTELTRDIRISKTARYLIDHGVDVSVLSCYSDISLPKEEIFNGIILNRITPLGLLFLGLSRSTNPPESAPMAGRKRTVLSEIAGIFNIIYFIVVQIRILIKILPRKNDFCHTNDWDTLLVGYLYSRLRSCVWVHDSHEIYAEQDPDFAVSFKKLVQFTERILFRRVDHLITVNRSIATYFMDKYNVSYPNIIHNCPVFEVTYPLDAGSPVKIVYVGLFEKNRGLEEIIDAMSSLDAELYLQGFGSLEVILRKKVEEQGLQRKVYFIDPVPGPQIVASLCKYDVGILPYKPVCLNNYLASPNKLFEYMMAGLAIVSIDIPEVRALVHECNNGLLYNPNDYKDLIEKVRILTMDRALIDIYRKKSLKCAQNIYYWDRQAQSLSIIYSL